MRFSGLAAGVMATVMAAGTVQGAEIVVLSTISCKEALIELVPEFEQASGHKVNITYAGGTELVKRIRGGTQADIFIGPEEFSSPLIAEGKLREGSRIAFAHSETGLAVRAGAAKPDISTPEKLKSALLAAGKVAYTGGASGIHFVQALEKLGIADAIAAKRVNPKPGELAGAVAARGDADIAVQQFSELLPVSGIEILGPLPAGLRQTIVYGATAFPASTQGAVAKAFVDFLRSPAAHHVLKKKGLEPA